MVSQLSTGDQTTKALVEVTADNRADAITQALATLSSSSRDPAAYLDGLALLTTAGVAWHVEDGPGAMPAAEWVSRTTDDGPTAETAGLVAIELGRSRLMAVSGATDALVKAYPGDVPTYVTEDGAQSVYLIDPGEDAGEVLARAGEFTRRSGALTISAGDMSVPVLTGGHPAGRSVGRVSDVTTAIGTRVMPYAVDEAGRTADAKAKAAERAEVERDRDAHADETPRDRRVNKRADDLEVEDEARREQRRRRDARREVKRAPVEAVYLDDLLAESDTPVSWLVDGLWSADGLCLLYAPGKTGKSRAAHGVIEALASRTPLWDRYVTDAPAGNIGLIDMEITRDMLRSRLRSLDRMGQGKDPHRVVTWSLRHDRQQFDMSDEGNMDMWARRLRDAGVSVLVLDCLSPAMRAAHMDEWTQGGEALGIIRQLAEDAGVQAVMVIDHASGKRSAEGNGPRGDSRKIDEPDQVWHLSQDAKNVPNKPSAEDRYWVDVTNRAGAPASVCLTTDGVRFTRAAEQDEGERLHSLAYRVYPALESAARHLRTEWELGHDNPDPAECWPPASKIVAAAKPLPGISRQEMRDAMDYLITAGCFVESGGKRPRSRGASMCPDHRPPAVAPTAVVVPGTADTEVTQGTENTVPTRNDQAE